MIEKNNISPKSEYLRVSLYVAKIIVAKNITLKTIAIAGIPFANTARAVKKYVKSQKYFLFLYLILILYQPIYIRCVFIFAKKCIEI